MRNSKGCHKSIIKWHEAFKYQDRRNLVVSLVEGGAIKVALIIGVSRIQNFPILPSTSLVAKRFGDWIELQNFEVFYHLDDDEPVLANSIYKTIEEIVSLGSVHQLLIYFTGHGFVKDFSEYWLLSGAPRNSNEAINITENIVLARNTGIPSVIFISDACRTIPDTLITNRIQGQHVFPNDSIISGDTEVDRFFATQIGYPAFDVVNGGLPTAHDSIFTSSFLTSFINTEAKYVTKFKEKNVLTNRSLKKLLPILIERNDYCKAGYQQIPQMILESCHETYIGEVKYEASRSGYGHDNSSLDSNQRKNDIRIQDIFDKMLTEYFDQGGLGIIEFIKKHDQLGVFINEFYEREELYIDTSLQCGFVFIGTDISVDESSLFKFQQCEFNQNRSCISIECTANTKISSGLIVEFPQGGGCCVVPIHDHVGYIDVRDGVVQNVLYEKSNKLQKSSSHIEKVLLKRVIALAQTYGIIELSESVCRSLEKLYIHEKSIDISIALVVAYAYAARGKVEKIHALSTKIRDVHNIHITDFEIFTEQNLPYKSGYDSIPGYPMFSAGWSYLSVSSYKLSRELYSVEFNRARAQWTTFNSEGMHIIRDRYKRGSLQ